MSLNTCFPEISIKFSIEKFKTIAYSQEFDLPFCLSFHSNLPFFECREYITLIL